MNSLVRMPTVTALAAPQTSAQGTWFWDGTQWVCDGPPNPCPPCPPNIPPFPCPPPGFPPPGCPPWFGGVGSPPWYPGANAGVSFGTTAPMNPVRGHFWWNGLGLALFDGAAWVDVATGEVVPDGGAPGGGGGAVIISATAPLHPTPGMEWWNGTVLQLWDGFVWKTVGPGGSGTTIVFGMTSPTNLTVTANTWSIIPYTSVPQVDTMSAWNPSTHRFTPTKAGIYMFLIREYSNAPAGGTVGIELIKNDSGSVVPGATSGTIAIQGINTIGAALGAQLSTTGVAAMNGTTDFVRLWGYTPNGTFYGAGTDPVFSAVLLP